MSTVDREIHLAARPDGWPTAGRTSRSSRPRCPSPADGQVLVRNLFMSVDPYMRGRMNDVQVLRAAVPARRRRWTAARSARSSRPSADGLAVGDIVAARARLARVRACSTPSTRRQGRPERRPAVAPTSACSACPASPRTSGLLDVAELQGGRRGVRLRRGRRGRQRWSARSPSCKGAARVIGSAGSAEKVALAASTSSASTPPSTTRTARSRASSQQAAPGRHRRLLRQRRRRAPGGGDLPRCNLHGRVAHLRRDLAVQRDRAAARPAQPGAGHRQAAAPCAASSSATTATCSRQFVAEVGRLAARRASCRYDETVVDGHRERPGRVPRPAARREHRQDARPRVTQDLFSRRSTRSGRPPCRRAEDRLAA